MAIQTYLEALEVIDQHDFPALKAKAYDNIGLVNYAMQNYERALENSKKALKINQDLGDSTNLIRNHNNLGIDYYMLKNFEQSLHHYTRSKELS